MSALLTHASYIAWSGKAVRLANDEWRSRKPYRGETILSRAALNHHLFRWGVGAGLIPDPGIRLNKPHSVYVAAVFKKDPEAVKAQARRFWKTLVDQHAKEEPRNDD